MISSRETRREDARRRAHDKFTVAKQREDDALSVRMKATAAVAAKTARLRALRLTKEALDKETADRAAAEKAQLNAERLAKKASGTRRGPAKKETEATEPEVESTGA